ncbi:MAG: hypothetical protein ACREOQ_10590 [Gemmatimonadales bacterium]
MINLARRIPVGLGIALLACGDPGGPDTGTLEVSANTQGEALDPDGFALSLDGGAAQLLGPNASLTFADLPAGSHALSLTGLAPNCNLSTPGPLTATVPAGGTGRVTFEVACRAPGDLEVTTASRGEKLDPDGYAVAVDGGAVLAIPPEGQVTIADLVAGDHTVRLSGLAPNCAVAGTNPITVAITPHGTQAVRFEVACPAWPTLRVAAVTSGSDPDTDGYQLQVDGDPQQPLGDNASVTLELAPGAHTLTLRGVAPNCAVVGANPRPVTLASGEAGEVGFEVSCTPLPPGQILVTTTTRSFMTSLTDPNGYTVSLDGGPTRHIGNDSTVTFTDVAPGSHSITLGDVYQFCGFLLVNPEAVSVRSGATASVRFNVTCIG